MKYYPIQLDIAGRACLVVGGGAVGVRKVATLLDCGARVTVVSTETVPEIDRLADQGRIALKRRSYVSADLDGQFLVIGATDDNALNRKISWDAGRRQMLCNIADVPEACNFILPSIVRRGDLTIAVSTSGSSPAFAKHLRRELEDRFGEEYGTFLTLMRAIRQRLLAEAHAPEAHKPLFERLIAEGLLERIRASDTDRINGLLREVLGDGYDYKVLLKEGADKGGERREIPSNRSR